MKKPPSHKDLEGLIFSGVGILGITIAGKLNCSPSFQKMFNMLKEANLIWAAISESLGTAAFGGKFLDRF